VSYPDFKEIKIFMLLLTLITLFYISLSFDGTTTVCCSFLFDLEEKFEEDMFTFHVCDVALKHAPEFRRVYLPYVTNQTYQEQTFQRLL